jgi:phospholipid-translocating ATPase
MIFKKLLLSEELAFSEEDGGQIKGIIGNRAEGKQEIERKRRVVNAAIALSLCHNVTPVIDNDVRGLQGSSPDELTLVSFAESLGYLLADRNEEEIVVDQPEDRVEFKILDLFPFTSESKSMGIIVKNNGKIIYYLKGADAVMAQKIGQSDANFMS